MPVAQFADRVRRDAIVERIAPAKTATVLAEFPGQHAIALALAIDDVGKGDRLFGREGAPERLNEHLDLAAAGQTDVEGHLVADAVRNQTRVILVEDLLGMFDDVVLDAATRDGANEFSVFGDGHLGAWPARGRTVGLYHRRDGHFLAGIPPALNIRKQFFHGSALSSSSRVNLPLVAEFPF